MSTNTRKELAESEQNPNQATNGLNPSQEYYNREFNDRMSQPDMQAFNDQGDAAIRDYESNRPQSREDSRQALQKGETNAAGATAGKALTTAADASGNVAARVGARIANKVMSKSGLGVVAGVIIVMLIVLLVGIIAPSSMLIHLKEIGTSWMSKHTNIGVNSRIRPVLVNRYFRDPASCSGPKALCKYSPGVSDEEIKKINESSDGKLRIDEGDIGGEPGHRYIRKMTFTDGNKTIDVTGRNFAKLHAANPKFRLALETHSSAKSLTFRSKFALKKYSVFNVDRSKPLGDGNDSKSFLRNLREKFYSKRNDLSVKPNTDENVSEKLDELDGIDNLVEEAQGDNILENGPNAVVPDTDALIDSEKALAVAGDTAKGSIKGAMMGIFASVDSACAIYNTIRVINFGVKVYAASQLIQYATMFPTIGDKQKVSAANMTEVAFLANVLLRPSKEPSSLGKDFSRSEGANLIFYGKVPRPEGLTRFSLGNTAMKSLNAAFETMSLGGASAETCRRVSSWWGQGLMFIGGLATTFLSGGLGGAAGAAMGATKALAMSFIMQAMIPKLIPVLAGTLIPDPATDPEGGYGAGNAISAGLGAFGGQLGRAKGMRPLTTQEFATLQRSDEARMLAQTNTERYNQMGMFNQDNPYSIQNQLAITLSPLVQPKNSFSEYVESTQSVIASTFERTFSSSASAAIEDEYGGKYCADDQVASFMQADLGVDLAKDANCNLIYGPDPATIISPDDLSLALEDGKPIATTPNGTTSGVLAAEDVKYGVQDAVMYMINNEHIDEETGEPTSDDYREYREVCVEGTDPILDKYTADLSEGNSMEPCYNTTDDKYRYFSVYTTMEDINGSLNDIAAGELGKASEADGLGAGTAAPGAQAPAGNLPQGSAQELAQKILDSGKVTGDPRYMGQIQAYARGDMSCNINPTILSLILAASQNHTLNISSLNRQCTGVLTASGTRSYHWRDKGGHAVDFNYVDGVHSTGRNATDIKLLNELAPLMPSGSGVGQSQCPSAGGLQLPSGIRTFNDTCHHIHIEVPVQ